MKPLHRPFVLCALAFLLVGSWLGVLMLPLLAGAADAGSAVAWPARLQAHGQAQIFGFCVVFTMGIALQMLGELLGARQSPVLVSLCLASMVAGTLGQAWAPASLWPALQLLSGLLFVAAVAGHRPPATTVKRNMAHSHFLRWGSLWLLAALAGNAVGWPLARVYELVLWGFLTLYILGVGLRVHPGMLGRSAPPPALQWTVLWLWNFGLVVMTWWPALGFFGAAPWLLASLLMLVAVAPWNAVQARSEWLPCYLQWSYGWLLLASIGRLCLEFYPHWAGAVKHAHASGFVLLMMVGMGLRLVPSFERKPLAWSPAYRGCFYALSAGVCLRVAGQAGWLPWALLPGGVLQMLGVAMFGLTLLATLLAPAAALSPAGWNSRGGTEAAGTA
jgi:uncharacterized protein involved in response to NO